MLRKEDSFNLEFILFLGIHKRLSSIDCQILMDISTKKVMNRTNLINMYLQQ